MTQFGYDSYNIYDTLPCCAAVFRKNEAFDIVYSNTLFNEMVSSGDARIYPEDRSILNKAFAADGKPECFSFRIEADNSKLINVHAAISRISDNEIFAVIIDNNDDAEQIRTLNRACARYAAAIRGTDEIFYEYVKATDTITIYFPTKEGTIESSEITDFFANMATNKFILEKDLAFISSLEDNIKTEKRFEFRMRLREDSDFSWYTVSAKPEGNNPGLFVGTARNIQALKDEEEKLKQKVLIDPLSKVYTRAAAVEKIEEQLKIRPENSECALIVLDIDNFKKINDTFGHMYGDAVIAMAAGGIKSTLDEADIIGRFGGDEFFVFIDNAEKEALETKLDAIRLSMLKMRLDQNDENDISCSIGVAIGTGSSVYDELFRQADSALYAAKRNGKNRFEYFDGTYSSEEALSYANVQDEDESNVAHNVTAIALEIASRSTNVENAITNIMRHIGMALELDCIQILRFDTIEDKVDLEFQWWREQNGEYNIAVTEKKSGYYNHNDLIIFKNRFAKEKIFRQTVEFEEGFSPKYQDVFKKMRHINYLHSSNTENDNIFYAATFQSYDIDRVWTEQELQDISEITKILSMYLKSSYVETEREKMLAHRLDYHHTGLYMLEKFFDEAGRITREARAANGKMGVAYIDIKDLYTFNKIHGGKEGDKIIDIFSKILINFNRSKAISARVDGTDGFIVLFHSTMQDDDIVKKIENELEAFCSQFSEYTDPPVILKAGLRMFEPGWGIGSQIGHAQFAKKGQIVDRCRCFIYED